MGSDYMSVETGALDKHTNDLGDHANDLRQLFERFNRSVNALGEPWGEGDSYAEQFREWYDPAHRDLLASLQSAIAMLEQVHAATGQASQLYKRAGAQSQQDVGELAREISSAPQVPAQPGKLPQGGAAGGEPVTVPAQVLAQSGPTRSEGDSTLGQSQQEGTADSA
ncbi:hypothetical protein [Kitasatospora sp. NPDC059571]|uniref:hypothetical protein n=1 Tax=Kitasatospora sp. NPDC059571 TaxID=3346871 RepID=UPI0036CC5AFA